MRSMVNPGPTAMTFNKKQFAGKKTAPPFKKKKTPAKWKATKSGGMVYGG